MSNEQKPKLATWVIEQMHKAVEEAAKAKRAKFDFQLGMNEAEHNAKLAAEGKTEPAKPKRRYLKLISKPKPKAKRKRKHAPCINRIKKFLPPDAQN